MAFSVIFRVPGQMSRFRGHFPPVSRFCAPLCRAGNSMEEKLTAGSFFIRNILPEMPVSAQVSKWTQITDLRLFYWVLHKAAHKSS